MLKRCKSDAVGVVEDCHFSKSDFWNTFLGVKATFGILFLLLKATFGILFLLKATTLQYCRFYLLFLSDKILKAT